MNGVSITEIQNINENRLKELKLDKESIIEFKEKIATAADEEKEKLGKELYDLLTNKKQPILSDKELAEKAIDLILKGANIEFKSEKKGIFPLLICARRGYIEVTYVLLRAGANVNQVNNFGTTSLMGAARHGNKEILELLILMDANVNAISSDGDNALMSAKRHNEQECFDILVKAQTYLNHRNLSNETILDISGNIKIEDSTFQKMIASGQVATTKQEDVMDLIDEANKKMLEIVENEEILKSKVISRIMNAGKEESSAALELFQKIRHKDDLPHNADELKDKLEQNANEVTDSTLVRQIQERTDIALALSKIKF